MAEEHKAEKSNFKKEFEEIKPRTKFVKYAILGDLLFVFLPLIIITIVQLSTGATFSMIIKYPEWSFGSAILFGQTIAKLVAGFSITPPKTWEIPVFVITSIIVLGLVPALIILSLLLVLKPVPSGLIIAQVVLFLLSTIIFYGFGGAGQAQSNPNACGKSDVPND